MLPPIRYVQSSIQLTLILLGQQEQRRQPAAGPPGPEMPQRTARTGPAAGNDDDLEAKVDAVFEQCDKEDKDEAKKAEEKLEEEN
ncbi:hypothetical protein CFAM422_003537 [Trichoderma lentiforme]|uniref:Uncharacterized protein n=1 Tax=Trichoderma lentiforme TaxID=1567552 RepID=A0A9P4XKG9_9HYPO|nr:hypothetical protein CFAM422_003537 [Trichoderma lentiforme]